MSARPSPDGSRVVYLAGPDISPLPFVVPLDMFSVETTGGGSPIQLTTDGLLRRSSDFRVNPEGTHVVYVRSVLNEPDELNSVSIDGGVPTRLNGDLVSGAIEEFDFAA